MERVKTRKPIVAFLLSLLMPGLGHVYNGQAARGTGCFCGILAYLMIAGASSAGLRFSWACITVALALVLQLIVALDAALGARKVKELHLKAYNRWYYYAAAFVLATAFTDSLIVPIYKARIARTRTFRVPAASMQPTLAVGDCFVARRAGPEGEKPKRGDVIVFPFPEDTSKSFVKRVVALEGEQLEIRNKSLFINNKLLDEPWAVHADSRRLPKKLGPRDNCGPITIPQGAVFVLGDNRDFSHDSRFWGCVQQKDIEGTALYIYWSNDWKRIGREVR